MYDKVKEDVVELAGVIGDTMSKLTLEYGPAVEEVALGVTRMEGVAMILPNMVGMFISVIIMLTLLYATKKTWHLNDEIDCHPLPVLCGIFSALTSIPIIVNLIEMCDVWAWTAIVSTKLYIAHQIIEGLTK